MTHQSAQLPALHQCLQHSNWRQLRRLMASHGIPTSRQQRKADLVSLLTARLLQRSVIANILPHLSPLAYRAIRALLAADGTLPSHRFTEDFGPFPPQSSPPTAHTAAPPSPTAALYQVGLIYPHRWDDQSHPAVVLPAELFTHLHTLIDQRDPPTAQPLRWWVRPGHPADLLWHLAIWLATVAGAEIRLIHGRWLPPHVVAALVERLGLDQDPHFIPRRSERYLPYLAFLHYLAESAGFVTGSTRLTLTPVAWAWLAAPHSERRTALWTAWCNAPDELVVAYRASCGELHPKARSLLLETLTRLATNGTLPSAIPLDQPMSTPVALALPQLVLQLRLHDRWGLLPGEVESQGEGEKGNALGLVSDEPNIGHSAVAGIQKEGAQKEGAQADQTVYADDDLFDWESAVPAEEEAQEVWPESFDSPLHAYCTGPLFWLGVLDLADAVDATGLSGADAALSPAKAAPGGRPIDRRHVRLGNLGRLWLGGQHWAVAEAQAAEDEPVRLQKGEPDVFTVSALVQPLHLVTLARLCRWEMVTPPQHFRLHLDAARVAALAAQGSTVAELSQDLSAALARPLSRREQQRLRAYTAAGHQARLRTLTILETADAESMASLRRRKLVRRRLGAPIGPNRVEVNPADATALAQTLATLGIALHVPPDLAEAGQIQVDQGNQLTPAFQWLLLRLYKGLGAHATLPVKPPWGVEQALAAGLSPLQRAAAEAAADQLLAQIRHGLAGYLQIPAWQLTQESADHRPRLEAAIADAQPLTIRYWTTSHGEAITRTITPYWIERRYATDYLVAYCHLRNEERTFRVDRIAEVT